jgi:hypothetical protein
MMSEERSAIVLPKSGSTKSDAQIVEEAKQIDESESEYEARIAQVLERGIVLDRLRVDLPDDQYGEWIKDDPASIKEAELLGFKIDREFAPKRSIHDDGTGVARMGDAIYMTIPKSRKQIIDRVKLKRRKERHNPAQQGEEQEYKARVRDETQGDIPVFVESKKDAATATDISEALTALKNQQRG